MKSDSECLFCKMATGAIPVPKVYEDDQFFCIRDIHPQAKAHLLVIPKEHIPTLAEAFQAGKPEKTILIGQLLERATQIAKEQGLLPSGFRTVLNTQRDA